MSATPPSRDSKVARLARAARSLRPIRAPFYVQHATPDTPLTGWWWQPAGAERPEPLAQSYDTAIVLIDRAQAAQRATKP